MTLLWVWKELWVYECNKYGGELRSNLPLVQCMINDIGFAGDKSTGDLIVIQTLFQRQPPPSPPTSYAYATIANDYVVFAIYSAPMQGAYTTHRWRALYLM